MQLIIQPEAGAVPIVKAIKTARKKIDIFIFRFDHDQIEKALAARRCSAASACAR